MAEPVKLNLILIETPIRQILISINVSKTRLNVNFG